MSDARDDVLLSGEAGGRVIRGSALRVAGNGAGILIGIVTATLLLRHLGVAESGRYVTVMSLVAIAGSIADAGLNAIGSRELALRAPQDRSALVANFLGLRMLVTPVAVLIVVAFTIAAGYPERMVAGAALAGVGLFLVAMTDAVLLRLTVELRNLGLAFVDTLKQVVTLAGVAALVALDAHLTPFFAIQVLVGLAVVAVTPLLVGWDAIPWPRFERAQQRVLIGRSLPLAVAFVLGQAYFRLVVVLMSLISGSQQTGYFGGSLRAMEALVTVPILVAGVALPVLAAAARDDHVRLRYAVRGLSEGAIVAGVLIVIVTFRAAEPMMGIIGGAAFRPSGAVLRIQVGALLFIALYQIWTASLIALGRQRELILINLAGLFGVAVFAGVLVPLLGARGGAGASVMGDALLASLVYVALRRADLRLDVRLGFLAKIAAAAAAATVPLLISALPDFVAAALAGLIYLLVGGALGVVPPELRAAILGWIRPATS